MDQQEVMKRLFSQNMPHQQEFHKKFTATGSYSPNSYSYENILPSNFVKIFSNTFKNTKQSGKSENFFPLFG